MQNLLKHLVFRTHVYNPRPSAGVLVDEDQEHDQAGQNFCNVNEIEKNKDLNRGEQRDYHGSYKDSGNINEGGGEERQKTFHHNFWHLLHASNMFQAVTWGPVHAWDLDRGSWKQKTPFSLLYQILFALPNHCFSSTVRPVLPIIKEECLNQAQPKSKQLAIKDAAGAALDQEINASKSETLEVVLKEFQKACYEYSACSESLLGLQAVNCGDMATAVGHLQHSCLLGNLSACFNLGLCHEIGSGVPQDKTKAIYYYQKAARGGHKQALYNLGLMCLSHGEDSTERAGAREDSKKKSCKKGEGHLGLSKDMGLDFLEEAARLGLPEAQTYLGVYLMEECEKPAQAVSYFKAAAYQNDTEAQYLLAVCYEQGLGVETNECLAARFYSMSAQAGHNLALYNLAVFNEEGLGGLPQNKANAVELYHKAAKLGSAEAQERLVELLGPDLSDSRNTECVSDYRTDNKDRKKLTQVVYGLPDGEKVAENNKTGQAFDSADEANPLFSLLSPSSSFPSLRSLSSYSIPRPYVKPPRMSSSQHTGMKLVVQDSTNTVRVSNETGGFLEKVNFFLGMSPTAMTLDHDIDVSHGVLPKIFSSHSISLSPFSAEEEVMDRPYPNLQRSRTSSDFSMIGI
ncbi:death ligand signal enhancer [Elysia marginata]|uniref:Death ligand signal enhancer n=1 Tax=Elysia marginata TaxID=1093978 RepID=A0AAV4F0A5_9GAST|nr:death ligand signal enhancer [Elysia marginata]